MPIYLEDRNLARRLLAGDERAFGQFFDENFARLYRFALARLSDDPEATREVVQTALTRALDRIQQYRGESALFTWLCVICRNELANWARRNASYHQHVVLSEDEPALRAVIEALDAPAADPVSHYQRHEATRLIQVVLDRLPPKYGDALEWKYIEGRSVKDIARRLGISTEAAQSLLARAKRAFRDLYGSLVEPMFEPTETREA